MDRDTFIATLTAERAQWDALLAQIDDAHTTEPGFAGDWSIKDLIAHIAWYERETADMIVARSVIVSGWWDLSLDERNDRITVASRARSLAEVRTGAQQDFAALVDAVSALSDGELNDPGHFAGMPADWIPWEMIAANSYEHYHQHDDDVRAWAARHP